MSVRTVSATEAKRRWSELVRRAERGEAIEITRRGKAIGRLVPPVSTEKEPQPKSK